jgi:hypothetical protein
MKKNRRRIEKSELESTNDFVEDPFSPHADWKARAIHDSEAHFKMWWDQIDLTYSNFIGTPHDLLEDEDMSSEQRRILLKRFANYVYILQEALDMLIYDGDVQARIEDRKLFKVKEYLQ